MKKTLIITYYWPPAGGPGVQRWLKFAKYLPECGIEPIIFAPENPHYPIVDESLIDEIPEGIEVIKLPIKEPYRHANKLAKESTSTISKGIIPSDQKITFKEKLLLFIRGNFFIPDARKSWVKPSVKFLSEYIIENDIKSVITTGPPHSLHLIGLKLKKQFGLKWIADFRDPWTSIGYHKKLKLTFIAGMIHKRMEKNVLDNADQIVVTSSSTKDEFRHISSTPIKIITNGYEEYNLPQYELDKKFSLSHIGTLLTNRNPEILWKALSELCRENNTFRSLLQINLVGTVSEEVIQSIENFELTEFLLVKGYVGHSEALKYQHQSQILLLIEIDSPETRSIIPGKLFEYLYAKRPIMAIGPEDWDVSRILEETNSGRCFDSSEFRKLKQTISDHFEAFRKNELTLKSARIDRFSRRSLTSDLAELI